MSEKSEWEREVKKLIWLTTRLEWMYVLMVGRSSSRSCQRTNRKKKQIYKRMYIFSLTRGWNFPSISSAKTRHVSGEKRNNHFCWFFFFGANLKEREWRIEGWLLIILILFYFFLFSILCVQASSCSVLYFNYLVIITIPFKIIYYNNFFLVACDEF